MAVVTVGLAIESLFALDPFLREKLPGYEPAS